MKPKQLPFFLAIFMFAFALISSNVLAQTVNVKMIINTSTCLDTLTSDHVVLVCGSSVQGTAPAITWDNTSGLSAVNIGGDYWEVNFEASVGDEISYKFVTYFDLSTPTFHWDGWEGPINGPGDNRSLIVGANDTTLALQYFNGWENKVEQFWQPFETVDNSVAVYFRVNMGGADFDPATQLVDVRGGIPLDPTDAWVNIVTLAREENSVNGGSFWSGVAYVPVDSLTPGVQQSFKFVIQPEIWESTDNRYFSFTENVIANGDTTIHWAYFNNQKPAGPKIDANILFRLKLDALEKAGMFNRALGDKIAITGAKGWPAAEFDFDTEASMLKMTYNSDLEEWNLYEAFSKFPAELIPFKYYISWDTSRVDSASPNWIPNLTLDDGWEEPGATGGADRNYVYTDQTEQIVAGDFGADQQFFNSLHPNGVITNPIDVTFSINMAPATNETDNPTFALFRPGVDTVYVQFDGSLVSVTQGHTMWGTDNRLMLTDDDGDGIYSGVYSLTPPTFNQFCYRIVYTSPTGEVWNGSGSAVAGRRYYQYAKPVSINPVVWPTSYALTEMEWMTQDLTIEDLPDLGEVTDVEGNSNNLPGHYELMQNYPNPFNPSTVITYTVPSKVKVNIGVYDILGQRVATLYNKEQFAGTHSIEWNSKNDSGMKVSTGIYLLKMDAGSFTQSKKMLLLR
jgi:FlgD Ig-like domain